MTLDTVARRRLTLYRMYLYLLMIVEMPSRGMTPQTRSERFELLGQLLDEHLSELGRR